jgi:hypothetical protein
MIKELQLLFIYFLRRRLLQRVAEAEEAAVHAESRAKLQFSRWQSATLLDYANRESMIAKQEQELRADRLAFDAERQACSTLLYSITRRVIYIMCNTQAQRDLLAAAPARAAELERVNHELGQLRAETLLQQQRLAAATADLEVARRQADAESRRAHGAEARLMAAKAACQRAETEAREAGRVHAATLADWADAVRLLRDKFAGAMARVRHLEQKLAEQANYCAEQSKQTLALLTAQADHLTTKFREELAAAQTQLVHEQERADSCAAETAGLRARVMELSKVLLSVRSRPTAPRVGVALSHSAPAGSRLQLRPAAIVSAPVSALAETLEDSNHEASPPGLRQSNLTEIVAKTVSAESSSTHDLPSPLSEKLVSLESCVTANANQLAQPNTQADLTAAIRDAHASLQTDSVKNTHPSDFRSLPQEQDLHPDAHFQGQTPIVSEIDHHTNIAAASATVDAKSQEDEYAECAGTASVVLIGRLSPQAVEAGITQNSVSTSISEVEPEWF